MWFRVDKAHALDLTNGHSLSVKPVDDARMVRTYKLTSYVPKPGMENVTLGEGYKTEDEAVSALDDFLSAHGVTAVAVQPPVTEEETNTEEE